MRAKQLLISIVFVANLISPALVAAQNSALNNAKSSFHRGDFESALNFIERAEDHSQTIKLAETWYYSYKINLSLALSSEKGNNDHFFDQVKASAKNCIDLDDNDQFLSLIRAESDSIVTSFAKNAENLKAEEQADEAYLQIKRIFCLLDFSTASKGYYHQLAAEYAIGAKQYEKAVAYYDYCIENNYEVRASILGKVNTWQLAGRKARAFSVVRDAYEKYPSSQVFLVSYIEMLVERKLLFSANDVISTALERSPNDPELLYLQGYIGIGIDNDLAIKAFEQSLSVDSLHYKSNFELGKLLLEEGKLLNEPSSYKKAKKYLERIRQEGEKNESYLEVMEDLYLHDQDFNNYQRIRELRNKKL